MFIHQHATLPWPTSCWCTKYDTYPHCGRIKRVAPSPSPHEAMNPQHSATYNQQQQQQISAQGHMRAYTAPSSGNTPSNDRHVPPLHTWTPPSHQELQLYDQLFTYTDDQRRNCIGGREAVACFMRSHVDQTVLREVKLRFHRMGSKPARLSHCCCNFRYGRLRTVDKRATYHGTNFM